MIVAVAQIIVRLNKNCMYFSYRLMILSLYFPLINALISPEQVIQIFPLIININPIIPSKIANNVLAKFSKSTFAIQVKLRLLVKYIPAKMHAIPCKSITILLLDTKAYL
jgi:hypothetical protein